MKDQPKALILANSMHLAYRVGWQREAAAELRRLSAEHEEDQRVIAVWRGRTQRAEAQRDALLEALKSTGLFLHHCWCDVQMNDYSFEKLNQQMAVVDAAIKAVEGEKT